MRAIRDRRASGRAIAAVLLTAAVVPVAAGCGGDDESSPATAADSKQTAAQPEEKPLTRAELIAKADTICVARQRALARLAVEHYKGTRFPNPTERLPWPAYAEDALALSKRTVRQLEALVPPPGLRDAYDAYVATHVEIEGLDKQALDAAHEDNDGPYYKARKTIDAGILERAELAEAVGLKKCSPNPFFNRPR